MGKKGGERKVRASVEKDWGERMKTIGLVKYKR